MAGTADVAIMESPPTGVPGTRTVRPSGPQVAARLPAGTPPPVDGVFIGEDLMRIGLVVAPRFELPTSIAICGRSNRESTTHS